MTMLTKYQAETLAACPTAHEYCQTAETIARAFSGHERAGIPNALGALRRKGLIDCLDALPGEGRTWARYDSAWFRHTGHAMDAQDADAAAECMGQASALEAAEAARPSARQAESLTWEGPRGPAILRRDIPQDFHCDSPSLLRSYSSAETAAGRYWRAAELTRRAATYTAGHGRRERLEQRVRELEILAEAQDADALATLEAPETAEALAEFDAQIIAQAAEVEAAEAEADPAEIENARVVAWMEDRVAWANSCGDSRLCFAVTGRHPSATFRPDGWPVIVSRDDGTTPAGFYADGSPYGCGKTFESPWQAIAHLLRDNAVTITGIEVAPWQGENVAKFWAASGDVAESLENWQGRNRAAQAAARGKVAPQGAEVLENGAEVLEAFPSPEAGRPDARVVLCDTRGQAGHRFATWWQGRPGPSGTIWGHYHHDLAEARADAIRRAARMTAESDAEESAEALEAARYNARLAKRQAEDSEATAAAYPDDSGYAADARQGRQDANRAALILAGLESAVARLTP